MIREVKNKVRIGSSDPYSQCSLAYRKYWAAQPRKYVAAEQRKFHKTQELLSLFYSGGVWPILGVVYSEQAIAEPLADYIWLKGPLKDD